MSADEELGVLGHAVAGGIGGVSGLAFTYPLDVVKTRMQVRSSPPPQHPRPCSPPTDNAHAGRALPSVALLIQPPSRSYNLRRGHTTDDVSFALTTSRSDTQPWTLSRFNVLPTTLSPDDALSRRVRAH